MFKKIILSSIIILLSLTLIPGVNAQFGWLPKAGITPDSPFYFLDKFGEKIGIFFSFSAESKAKKAMKYAEERLAEARVMAEKKKTNETKEVAQSYEQLLDLAEKKINKVERKEEIASKMGEATSKHLAVLEDVLEKVPEKAKEAIKKAKKRSKEGHVTAVRAVAKENPNRAVQINTNAVKERLKKAKAEAKEKREEKLKEAVGDYKEFKEALKEEKKKNKTLAVLVTEAEVGEIEDLDEIEEEAEEISKETEEKIKEIKSEFQEEFKESLRELAEEKPERAAEINFRAVEVKLKQLEKIKEKIEEKEGIEIKEEAHAPKYEEAEVEKMKKKIQKITKEFKAQNEFGEEISEIAKGLGKNATSTVDILVEEATSHHLEVLRGLLDKVPEQARQSIKKTIDASSRGHERAVEAIRRARERKEREEEERENEQEREEERREQKEEEKEREEENEESKNEEEKGKQGDQGKKQGCKELWWHDSKSEECQQKEFCGLYMYQGLETFKTKEGCKESLEENQEKNNEKAEVSDGNKYEYCAQVITPARNPDSGVCKEFSTPCDVPSGWKEVESCE